MFSIVRGTPEPMLTQGKPGVMVNSDQSGA
jgi:hypothetical protein